MAAINDMYALLSDYVRATWPCDLSVADRQTLLGLQRTLTLRAPHIEELPVPFRGVIPGTWLDVGDDDHIVGCAGLSRAPTDHAIEIDTGTVFGWCAFDCLFLPEILGRACRVRSKCPATQHPIALEVGDDFTVHAPAGVCVSFVTPPLGAVRHKLRSVFCAEVRFFDNQAAARGHVPSHAHVVDLPIVIQLAKLRNRVVFGDILAA